jgi:hypothetical protein
MQTVVTGSAGVPARVLSQITANSSEGLTKNIQRVKFYQSLCLHSHSYLRIKWSSKFLLFLLLTLQPYTVFSLLHQTIAGFSIFDKLAQIYPFYLL